ncbi:hypothetical protein [Streptomyces sp. NPDC058045]|uniref:hypothetical protein n=1 Tax=Streptomyces sp. NPDC058045 TaxID=3346311 RepID=UPI0036E0EE78
MPQSAAAGTGLFTRHRELPARAAPATTERAHGTPAGASSGDTASMPPEGNADA